MLCKYRKDDAVLGTGTTFEGKASKVHAALFRADRDESSWADTSASSACRDV
jgi:hypothetical protein